MSKLYYMISYSSISSFHSFVVFTGLNGSDEFYFQWKDKIEPDAAFNRALLSSPFDTNYGFQITNTGKTYHACNPSPGLCDNRLQRPALYRKHQTF